MRLQIGDQVAVLDDVIKGIVVALDCNVVRLQDDEGMLYNFNKEELVKVDANQDSVSKKSVFKKVKKEVVLEVDLHAEKLVKSIRGMDNYDILNIQINAAKHKLEYAIQKKIYKIIFIHGVGEGVLKKELHYLLNRYPVKYSAGSYKHYGLGATEVYVYQN